ncbi:MAG: hypothetical protein COX62_07380 [Deltaproteobacteria bacterium CG_4_10_14_0_2_um_filter_43_8]|nr:MAG: hypothetical protein COV43_07155 [Deltaproteobacteria bacterium CG11_big_fil_rev_8_21_14_0_20_42_23]PJA19066.1 MAG: hypothetical protein COX62_07380 [Deltaproteobacteria bacterium CG_4_10_14_0_2_um_filter_43_8]PJC64173.1 MAG: hypothetical protein CO021_05520 [Deltaproteobacteria bacterium CG_4_9_14_0_2_um_filter_42_21]
MLIKNSLRKNGNDLGHKPALYSTSRFCQSVSENDLFFSENCTPAKEAPFSLRPQKVQNGLQVFNPLISNNIFYVYKGRRLKTPMEPDFAKLLLVRQKKFE